MILSCTLREFELEVLDAVFVHCDSNVIVSKRDNVRPPKDVPLKPTVEMLDSF